jgi:hypothetical protein
MLSSAAVAWWRCFQTLSSQPGTTAFWKCGYSTMGEVAGGR